MEKTLKILNEEGLHARPAGIFVKEANNFKSDIEIDFNGNKINGKSIMSIMGLGLLKNSEITLIANGEDADKAIDHLANLVENKFEI